MSIIRFKNIEVLKDNVLCKVDDYIFKCYSIWYNGVKVNGRGIRNMFFYYSDNKIIKKDRLYEALEIDIRRHNIISVVGGGGKTTTIYTLAEEFSNLGKKVIIITTTHMKRPQKNVILNNNISEIKNTLLKDNVVIVGCEVTDTKIGYVGDELAYKLIDLCDFLLVEADGAKMLPLKAPAAHEPVIFDKSSMVIGVAGIDALDKEINNICHRPEIVSEVLNKNTEESVNEEDIAYLLSSDKGQMKGVKEIYADYRAIINKADNVELLYRAKIIAGYLGENKIKTVITSYIK